MNKQRMEPSSNFQEGPKISHPTFASGLILFTEATVEQTHVIQRIIQLFCESSGQKVSNENTRIFFSENVN